MRISRLRADGRDVEADFLIRDLNEWDDFSLEEAVKIKEASQAPLKWSSLQWVLRKRTRACASASRRARIAPFASGTKRCVGSDPIAIARVLAAVARKESPDMLFAGVQSSDHGFASTGIATAGFLGWPHGAVVANLVFTPGANTAVFRRELEGGLLHEVEIECPAVLTIQAGINTPRYASLRSIKQAAAKPIEVQALSAIGLGAEEVGERGSLSRVRRMYIPDKGRAQLIEGSVAEQAKRLAEIIREFKGEA